MERTRDATQDGIVRVINAGKDVRVVNFQRGRIRYCQAG